MRCATKNRARTILSAASMNVSLCAPSLILWVSVIDMEPIVNATDVLQVLLPCVVRLVGCHRAIPGVTSIEGSAGFDRVQVRPGNATIAQVTQISIRGRYICRCRLHLGVFTGRELVARSRRTGDAGNVLR
jgi:hypothetical protein